MLASLQGIVNRAQPRIYLFLNGDKTDQTWLRTTNVPNSLIPDPLSLVGKYSGETAGAVIYDPILPDTVNVATSLAAVMDGVIATADLASQYHLPVLADLRGQFATKLDAYNWLIDNYFTQLTPRLLTAISPTTLDLRDYIVATKSLVFWLDPEVPGEAALFAQILRKVAPDTPYMGWFVGGHESSGVTLCSQNGVVVGAADFLDNATVLGGVAAPIGQSQPKVATPKREKKIYLTFTFSDGDNLQYDQHRLRTIWDDPNRGKSAAQLDYQSIPDRRGDDHAPLLPKHTDPKRPSRGWAVGSRLHLSRGLAFGRSLGIRQADWPIHDARRIERDRRSEPDYLRKKSRSDEKGCARVCALRAPSRRTM